ncbi:beta-galactosidase [Streptomyces sp. B22F1]|uniref:beta-galactosidase n=1 Tax=Streptomyces sp. B22F1 TaxID=3153566 RepID=UPI00325D6BF7
MSTPPAITPSRRTVLGGLGAAAVTTPGVLGGAPEASAAAASSPAPAAAAGTRRAASPVTYRNKQIHIDGGPALVLGGEIPHFRLKCGDWRSRLDKAKTAGLNAIATYIPWMWHETPDGRIDVTGRTRPERDLGAFPDLCIENGFDAVVRPGPFTMAELKGGGVPERVRREHPEINPKGWHGADATTPAVDHLAPAFLEEARRWYDAVMPVIARRLRADGRPGIIACQLDNEIGMRAEYDDLALGFVPDHYLTEYHPDTDAVRAVVSDVEPVRGSGPRGAPIRGMLLGGYRYRSVDLQAGDLDPARTPVPGPATGEYLDTVVQRRLVRYLRAGGKLLLSGLLPGKDMSGRPSTGLRAALGLTPGRTLTDANRFSPSVTAHGRAAPRAEIRVPKAQLCTASPGSGADAVLRELSTGQGCGFDIPVGAGRAVVVTSTYRCDLGFWTAALRRLGAEPRFTHDAKLPGVFLLTTADGDRGRLLHAFNISPGYGQDVTAAERGKPLFGGERLHLPGRGAAMLPLGVRAGGLRIAYATAEISEIADGRVASRALGDEAVVAVDGPARCTGAKVSVEGGRTLLRVGRREFTVHRG